MRGESEREKKRKREREREREREIVMPKTLMAIDFIQNLDRFKR